MNRRGFLRNTLAAIGLTLAPAFAVKLTPPEIASLEWKGSVVQFFTDFLKQTGPLFMSEFGLDERTYRT